MASTNRLSVFISSLLDSMGFSRHMIDFRTNNTRYWDLMRVSANSSIGTIITGGKAEGTSQLGQGDIDIMSIFKLITVTSRNVDPPSPQHTMLYTKDTGAHPGYTWLRDGRFGDMGNIIERFMVLRGGATTIYLPSSDFNQIVQQYMMQSLPSSVQFQQISGPAQPTLSNGIQMDHVHALPHLDWPVQACKWMDRCRRHGWPPENIVTAIVQCGCHVVPKGFKGSPTENMEWCFSFAVHEKSILQLFSLTQKHVYILLKIIAKDLKESFPDLQDILTSYTMKTVALWQVELHYTKDWERYHLLDRLMEALDFLKSCVESQNLPAYFIPENNLFDGKINDFAAAVLSRLLNNLLHQGAGFVLTFPSIQQRLQIIHNAGLYWSGAEMCNLISICCQSFLHLDLSENHMLRVLKLIASPGMTRHSLFTIGVSKIMKATLAYINISKIKKSELSNRKKCELFRSLLHIASANIDTDRISGRVKFAGVLHVLGKTKEALQTLYSLSPLSMFGTAMDSHERSILRKETLREKTDSDDIEAAITRLGRDTFVQQCVSLDVRYTMEEIDITPNVIKYELFHVPETIWSHCGAYVDPDFLRNYLLYKCYTELGDKANTEAAFVKQLRIATREGVECREVALNVLGLCYLEKEDYLRSYTCFCRAMSLRPRLLVGKSSTSTPWHLAVLASKLINR